MEEDPDFGAGLQALLARFERSGNGASSVTGSDLLGAKGGQAGSFNTQTNTSS